MSRSDSPQDLCTGFVKYFTIGAAMTPHMRKQVYRVRHEVYCEELGFEAKSENGEESDPFDQHSTHCLLQTVENVPVGCCRLVHTNPANPDTPLPFERFCSDALDRSLIDPSRLPRDRIGEVSRLAVRKAFRRRRGEENQAAANMDFGTDAAPRFPFITIGLYLGAIAMAHHSGIDTIFVLTEPRLATHFCKLGVEIQQIGSPIEHRGYRIPSMIDVPKLIDTMWPTVRPIWNVVQREIELSMATEDYVSGAQPTGDASTRIRATPQANAGQQPQH